MMPGPAQRHVLLKQGFSSSRMTSRCCWQADRALSHENRETEARWGVSLRRRGRLRGTDHGGAEVGEGAGQRVLPPDEARRLLVRLCQVHLQLPHVLPHLLDMSRNCEVASFEGF